MIHLLEVTPELSLRELKKLSRRYAMTGGYELHISEHFSREQLQKLVALFAPEVQSYQSLNSECKASNAYRILSLVLDHAHADSEIRETVAKILMRS